MSKSAILPKSQTSHVTAKRILSGLYESPSVEAAVKALSPQVFYALIQENGISECLDIIELASTEQLRVCLDFDIWEKDSISEDRLISWLLLTHEEGGLEIQQKILKSLDLKIVGLLIAQHVQIITFEQNTDQPPGKGFYTPDGGSTWIFINTENPDLHFALGRLLALLYETSTEVFFQVISIPTVSTPSLLEEESYQERNGRLSGEGIPDIELASEIFAPCSSSALKEAVEKGSNFLFDAQVSTVFPIIHDIKSLRPFSELYADPRFVDDVNSELTLILNAAVIRYGKTFYEHEDIKELAGFISGAVNIGIELIHPTPVHTAYRAVGITKLFQAGLSQLMSMRNKVKKLSKDNFSSIELSIFDAATSLPPAMPTFLSRDGDVIEEHGHVLQGIKPVEHLDEIASVMNNLGIKN